MSIIDEIKNLKNRLNHFEEETVKTTAEVMFTNNDVDNQRKEEINYEKVNYIINKKNPIIKINVGGKLFYSSLSLFISIKGSLFEELYKDSNNQQEVMFIDRSYDHFDLILNYLKYKVFDIKNYTFKELQEIKFECEYYILQDLAEMIGKQMEVVEFINYEISAKHSVTPTFKLSGLYDTDLKIGGICVLSPFHIIIEFNMEVYFDKIEVGGCTINPSLWAPSNGSNATILTSTNKLNWKEVGRLPADFGAKIITVKLLNSKAKYIKFQHTSNLGIGYLKIIK